MPNKECKDHLGNIYPSAKVMCDKYNITISLWRNRKRAGWDLEKILTTPARQKQLKTKEAKDHLGNIFNSLEEMLEYYNITYGDYKSRKSHNWDLEKILTTTPKRVSRKCKDHLGNLYNTEREMYNNWEMPEKIAQARKKAGWSIEKILTTPHKPLKKMIQDPITNNLELASDLAKKYNVPRRTLYGRLENGYSTIAALGISVLITNRSIYNQTKYNLTVHKRIKKGKDVFECYIDNSDGTSTFKIMTYEMIDQYCLEQYKKLHNISAQRKESIN